MCAWCNLKKQVIRTTSFILLLKRFQIIHFPHFLLPTIFVSMCIIQRKDNNASKIFQRSLSNTYNTNRHLSSHKYNFLNANEHNEWQNCLVREEIYIFVCVDNSGKCIKTFVKNVYRSIYT